jgi:hypothetical protein
LDQHVALGRHFEQLCAITIASQCGEEEVGQMDNTQRRLQKVGTFVLGAATLSLLWLPSATRAQSTATQDRQASDDRQAGPGTAPGDDVTRRDLARFDQFLDSHRDVAEQLRKTPSLIDDPQYLRSHPELNTYLQDHPSVKQEISQQPNTFMRLEDQYGRDQAQRDRDAGWQGNDASRRDVNRDAMNFDRFLDDHREIGEQVRKNPSLVDDRQFVDSHPALRDYLQNNPGVRDQLRQDPNAFMHLADNDNRDMRDRDAVGQDNDATRRDVNRDAMNFDRFLDDHREIGEQIRKNPSLADDRQFVDSHPALQAYLQNNPGVRDQLRQDPNAFMHQADVDNHDFDQHGRDAMHDHMADFGGFLGSHPDIQKDVSRDPSCVKDHQWVQNHAEFDAYMNAHPDVRNELMADPEGFVHGAMQYNNGSTPGAGVSGRGTGTSGTTGTTGTTGMTGTSTGTSTSTSTSTHVPTAKPNQ